MKFPVWLEPVWHDLLRRHHASGLPHAMLFAGAEGLGKQLLSDRLTKYLLCQKPSQDSECGRCQSCMALRSRLAS